MRMALAVLLNSLLILSVPTPLVAKGKIVKITIKGTDLKTLLKSPPRRFLQISMFGRVQEQVPTHPDSMPTRPASSSTGLEVQSENRPRRYGGIKSRSTQVLRQMNKSFT